MQQNDPIMLIADSGSTKTDWLLTDTCGNTLLTIATQGINPVHQTEEQIADILRQVATKLSESPSSVCFYGAGVLLQNQQVMFSLLKASFHEADYVCAESDLLGAARSLCGSTEGVACILGTGANSCLYDGCSIVQNTPPLGYILGDEGSGAVLGRRLLNALYKGALPARLREEFEIGTQLTLADIITKVYRQPMANRFLASLCPFIHEHLSCQPLREMVVDEFRRFFRMNVAPYEREDLPVSFVGSVATYFASELGEAAAAEGFCLGRVVRSPMSGLVAFHTDAK